MRVWLSEVGWHTLERATLICNYWLPSHANDDEYLQPSSGRVATAAARPDGTDGRAAAWQVVPGRAGCLQGQGHSPPH